MQPNASRGRFRQKRLGPESELVANAIETGLPFSWVGQGTVLREPELASGAPDILLLKLQGQAEARVHFFSEQDLKLLHFVSTYPVTGLSDIVDLLQWKREATSKSVRRLEDIGLLSVGVHKIAATRAARLFMAKEIIAIEAKIGGWRRALIQACRNQWFASQSYILINVKAVPEEAIQLAREAGVGILNFDGERTRAVLRAARMRLPGSYASWQVSLWGRQEMEAV